MLISYGAKMVIFFNYFHSNGFIMQKQGNKRKISNKKESIENNVLF